MANINKIQLPNGTQYDIEDAVARGKSVMVVTITSEEDSQTGETTYSADKTYAEISAHIEDGGIAFCEYNGIYYPMTYCDDYVVFELTGVIGEQQVRSDTFYIGNNNGDYVEYESNLTSGEVFIVTFSGSGNNRSCNKTYSEIYTAYFQNKVILGRRGDVATTPIYHLSSASNDEFVFTAVNATDSSTVFFYSYTIQSDNTITYSEYSSSKMMVVTLSNVSDGQGTASKTSSQIMQYDGPVVCFYNGSIFYLKSIDVQDADTIYASFGEINSSGEYTSIVINYSGNASITTNSIGGTQSDWEEDDSTDPAYVLNRPAIRAGEGENSIVEGQIEQDNLYKEYKIYITGEAKATTFTYTTEEESIPSAASTGVGYYAYIASLLSLNWNKIKSIDTSNNIITFYKQLSNNAISNTEVIIYMNANIASGKKSHKEGSANVTFGGASHSEGQYNVSSGIGSHSEGYGNLASGHYSHVEGRQNIAFGSGTHVEGYHNIGYGTGATYGQHVEGKYNIEDPNYTYAHIVGNGTSSARSNAHTLDWSGNAWYAGSVSAGTAQSPAPVVNDNDLATKAYVDSHAGGGVTPDWNENDSTDDAYIQNRTHYKTSLGYILPVDLIEYTKYLDADEITFEIDGVEHTYSYFTDFDMDSLPFLYGEWNFPNGGTDADLDLTVQTAELVVDGVAQNLNLGIIYDGSYPSRVYYNSEYLLWYEYGNLYYYANNNTPKQSLILRLPMANECFEYTQKLDSNYLDGGLIISGTGYKSEIFNGTEGKAALGGFSHVEGGGEIINISVTLTGDANATEYQFSSDSLSYYDKQLDFLSDIGTLFDVSYNPVNIGFVSISLNGNNGGYVEFTETLDAQNALVGAQYYISLPSIIASGDCSHAEGSYTTASGQSSHAEGSNTIASGYGSHAEGNGTYAPVFGSHAEGGSTIASGDYSHAEGFNTTASGNISHAEGSHTTASGYGSHAEGGYFPGPTGTNVIFLTGGAGATTYDVVGITINSVDVTNIIKNVIGLSVDGVKIISQSFYSNGRLAWIQLERTLSNSSVTNTSFRLLGGTNMASNYNSHAEGTLNLASGQTSHAEGAYNVASGPYSHVEGYGNTASANNSHAEGYQTIAQHRSNHVFGEYNLADTGGIGTSTKGTYIEIVGNGTADNARSNARTLDWSGNGWYAGKVSAGTVASPAAVTNANDLTTKAYVDAAVSDSSDVMVVTITGEADQQTGDLVYSADKTFAEIYAHLNAGNEAFCKDDSLIYLLRQYNAHEIIFTEAFLFGNDIYGTIVTITENEILLQGYATTVPQASQVTPSADGTGSTGLSIAYARADHVHPTDTSRAPVNSPALTGTPTAPTAAAGTNTTQIATTQFVNSAVSSALTSVMTYKGTKATVAALPSSGNAVGDVWHVTANGSEYAWDGSTWQELGTSDKEVMVVTITEEEDQQTGDLTYSANKTPVEIYNHISNGGIAICDYYGDIASCKTYYYSEGEYYIEFNNSSSYTDSDGNIVITGRIIRINRQNDSDTIRIDDENSYIPQGASLIDGLPLADGTASRGSSLSFARADHVHPKITQTLSMSNNVITLTGSDGTTSSVTLPVFNGSMSVVTGGSS